MSEQITSLARLCELAKERRSITAGWPPPFLKNKPAAFIIGMPGNVIQRMIDSGMYLYEKKEKKG